ncbi:hypothetical protein [Pseudomonas sp. Irchel 3E19]|uniref:hypothetical protein n=1 Tax=Pseudomonas sp. Irchel 3E19 TaxID=2008981 RepID=UPI0014832145|nr:hypothetical protein [Pseudomonas sp. Irchel 3E19]
MNEDLESKIESATGHFALFVNENNQGEQTVPTGCLLLAFNSEYTYVLGRINISNS